MHKKSKIYVAGHRGLVGSAILRYLQSEGYINLVVRTHSEVDLEDQRAVERFFEEERPEYVFLAAARVGGIMANNLFPADFIRQNILIQTNVIAQAYATGAKKLLFLGSSCIYPKLCPQPMKEEYLLTGRLEPTNEAYALAKIAGIMMCQSYNRQYGSNFISVMPANVYGPNDNFDLEHSHVIAALIRKMIDAKERGSKEVVVWGTGNPKREFLYVDDLAEAAVFLMKNYNESGIINVGTGVDLSIAELAQTIKNAVGFTGGIVFDREKPDGTPRKVMDTSRLSKMGFHPQTSLSAGIHKTIEWYRRSMVGDPASR